MVSAGADGSAGLCVVGRPGRRLDGWPDRSGGPEGERVEVVGEGRPGGPGAGAGGGFQAGAVEPVASFEVADAAFGADAELREPAVGLAGVWGVVAADEQPVWFGQVRADGAGLEAAVEGDLAWAQLEVFESLAGGWQELGLVERADAGAGGEGQAAGAAARVLAQLAELHDVAELGRLVELALADRSRVGVADRDQPVADRLARQPQPDLGAHPGGQLAQALQPLGRPRLWAHAAAASGPPQAGRQRRARERAHAAGRPAGALRGSRRRATRRLRRSAAAPARGSGR